MNHANPIPAAPKPRKPRAKKTPGEAPTETIQAAASPSSETLLHVDLWTDKTPNPFQPLAAQMVSDLILGTAGTVQSSTESAISASFRSTRQAIAAVRNLCLLIDGFSTTGNANLHAAFTLCYAGDLEHRSSPPTEPQRVLLIGAVCDVARTIPGLRFRELPPNAKAPHCTTLELLTPAHHQRAASRPTPAALATAKPLEVSPQKPAKLPVGTPSSSGQPEPASNPKRRMQIFAAAGVAGLVVIGGIVFALRPATKPQPAAVPTRVATAVPAVAPPPQPATIAPAASTTKPGTPIEPRKQPPPPAKVKQPTPPTPQEHETPTSSSSVTFSPDEIRRMIASADKLSGDGNYDRAITLYDAVLKVDRKNAAALGGRQRAVYNRDHR